MKALEEKLEEKGIEVAGKSDAGKKIGEFDSKTLSDTVFSTIKGNQSFRFVFNYILKQGSFTRRTRISKISEVLRKEVEREKTSVSRSFVARSECRCGEAIKNVCWEDYRENCPVCEYELHGWERTQDIEEHHIERLLGKMEDEEILERKVEGHCISCSRVQKNIKLNSNDQADEVICESCGKILRLEIMYGLSDDLESLEKQGYWLEWYISRILEDEFGSSQNTINSIKYKEKNKEGKPINGGEVDVISLITGADKIATVSCYDTHSKVKANKLQEILQFTEMSDLVIFATTGQINRKNCKHILDRVDDTSLILVEGGQLEDIGELIRESLIKDFSNHLENQNMDKISSYLYLYSYSYSDSEKEDLLEPALELAQENVVDFIKTFARIDYRDFHGFPEDVAKRVEDSKIKSEGSNISKLLNSTRWERVALAIIFLRNAYSELAKRDKTIFASKLESLSEHRSVYVREEVIKTVKKLYETAPESAEEDFKEIILRLSSDGTYVESTAKELMSEYNISARNKWIQCDYCLEAFPDREYYEHHLAMEHGITPQ